MSPGLKVGAFETVALHKGLRNITGFYWLVRQENDPLPPVYCLLRLQKYKKKDGGQPDILPMNAPFCFGFIM
jgi:hypothetical protein